MQSDEQQESNDHRAQGIGSNDDVGMGAVQGIEDKQVVVGGGSEVGSGSAGCPPPPCNSSNGSGSEGSDGRVPGWTMSSVKGFTRGAALCRDRGWEALTSAGERAYEVGKKIGKSGDYGVTHFPFFFPRNIATKRKENLKKLVEAAGIADAIEVIRSMDKENGRDRILGFQTSKEAALLYRMREDNKENLCLAELSSGKPEAVVRAPLPRRLSVKRALQERVELPGNQNSPVDFMEVPVTEWGEADKALVAALSSALPEAEWRIRQICKRKWDEETGTEACPTSTKRRCSGATIPKRA